MGRADQPTALTKFRQAEESKRSDHMVKGVRKPERRRGRRIWWKSGGVVKE